MNHPARLVILLLRGLERGGLRGLKRASCMGGRRKRCVFAWSVSLSLSLTAGKKRWRGGRSFDANADSSQRRDGRRGGRGMKKENVEETKRAEYR